MECPRMGIWDIIPWLDSCTAEKLQVQQQLLQVAVWERPYETLTSSPEHREHMWTLKVSAHLSTSEKAKEI